MLSILSRMLAVTVLLGVALSPPAKAAPAPEPGSLTRHNISAVYVAGVSSGGYMATQLHVAHSGTFRGAGIFSAGPYGCAQGSVWTALYACMQTWMVRQTPSQLQQLTRDRAAQGKVDPPANLSDDPVYVFHGSSDSTVVRAVNNDLASYYRGFNARVAYNNTSNAGHAWISPLGPGACTTTASPYINNCGTDVAGEMLGHLFGGVNAPAAPSGRLLRFDQTPYVQGGTTTSMGTTGFAYIPAGCASGSACKLLVALHGCKQGYDTIGTAFVDKAYLNEYADPNNVIVLYPQATPRTGSYVYDGNPNGCWNWWGYFGDTAYDTKAGKQIDTIMRMVRALTG